MSDLISVVNGYSSYNIKKSAVQNPVTTENKAQFVNENKKLTPKIQKPLLQAVQCWQRQQQQEYIS